MVWEKLELQSKGLSTRYLCATVAMVTFYTSAKEYKANVVIIRFNGTIIS